MPDNAQQLVAVGLFLAAYVLIVTDKVHRTIVALFAGFLIVALGIVPQHAALAHIDLNVIFLLAGMMVIANVIARSGFFRWLAVRIVRLTKADPYRLLVALALVSTLVSALLDNVTAVVLLAPIAFSVAERRGMSALPLLISIVLASNIGGTATLIGDPPNIIIGSAFGKDFVAFLLHTAPAALASLLAYLLMARRLFRADLRAAALSAEELRQMTRLDESVVDRTLASRSLVVLAATIVLFLFARPLGLEGATIALLGASAVLLVSRIEVHDVLAQVEWPTLFFFVGLFVLVGALVDTGVVGALAGAVLAITAGRPEITALAVLWLSALLSAIVDNIPYTATMVPLLQELARQGLPIEPSVWALALGAGLGGNATLIGASANVVVASMSEARGEPIAFLGFLRYGLPVTGLTIAIATVDLALRYFLFR
ncbi:MAG TPA: ArsB/NhaD family transporter [Candidatus Limnocylindria bacterium]|nr:ArsB/NhaD family transporter [Candidatus Limnocylindria bacterium]